MPNIIKQIVTNKPNTIKMIVKSSERGAQGVQGVPGAAATIEAGQAYSVSPNSEPSVQNVGSSSAAVFDFYIPKGEQGEPGTPGTNGKDGKDGRDGAVQYKAGVGIVIDPTTNTISATGQATGGAWGTITGDIADQTDLQEEFGEYTKTADLATVATSGSYSDLSNTPTIPAAQIQSNWTQTDTSSKDFIKNKPTLATVATSGSYNDLSDKPTLANVATSGSYVDLSNKPTIPTITMTSTDPGEGSALAANNFVAVYGGTPINGSYSTTEINTGETWIDGRAVYKRTFFFDSVTSTAMNAEFDECSSSNYFVVGYEATAKDRSIPECVSLPATSTSVGNITYSSGDGYVYVNSTSTSQAVQISITVKYVR